MGQALKSLLQIKKKVKILKQLVTEKLLTVLLSQIFIMQYFIIFRIFLNYDYLKT